MVAGPFQLVVTGPALRDIARRVNLRTEPTQKMLDRTRLLLLGLCALALGCDALPKFQFKLQSEIQREFRVTSAMVMVIDTTTMVVMVFDDAHAAFEPKELAGFEAQVAQYAVTHYQRGKLKSVGVMVGRASRKGSERPPEPVVFLPEYHSDGSVRLALIPSGRMRAAPALPEHQ